MKTSRDGNRLVCGQSPVTIKKIAERNSACPMTDGRRRTTSSPTTTRQMTRAATITVRPVTIDARSVPTAVLALLAGSGSVFAAATVAVFDIAARWSISVMTSAVVAETVGA